MDSRLDGWRSILTIIVFFITNLVVIFPFVITVPKSLDRPLTSLLVRVRMIPQKSKFSNIRVKFSYKNVPVISVLFLLMTTAIDGSVLRTGIVGSEGIRPLDIMSLFISLAYLSISLDATGLLRFLAFRVAQKGGSSGRRLYLYLFAFFFISGLVIGNDPVILSGTAFLAYLTRMTGISPPTAWTYAQFTGANLASALLVSSNPTNLVLAGAFRIQYTTYSAFLILPTLFSAIVLYPTLAILFVSIEKQTNTPLIPANILISSIGDEDPGRVMLHDKSGAIVGSVLLCTTLAVLVGTSPVKPAIPVWRITTPGALLMLIRDVFADRHTWWGNRSRRSQIDKESPSTITELQNISPVEDTKMSVSEATSPRPSASVTLIGQSPSSTSSDIQVQSSRRLISPSNPTQLNGLSIPSKDKRTLESILSAVLFTLRLNFPTVFSVISNLPVSLLPFAFSIFTLVEGLQSRGWLSIFATWWMSCQAKVGNVGAVFVMTVLSSLLCNACGTNIGTTILLARTLQLSVARNQVSSESHEIHRFNSIIFALAFGSNIGAYTFSFSASLAGLLWRDILRQKGVHVKRREFALINVLPWVVSAVVGSAVFAIQGAVMSG